MKVEPNMRSGDVPDNYYINEIRQTRERIAKECGDDLDRILDRVQKTALDLGFASDVRD